MTRNDSSSAFLFSFLLLWISLIISFSIIPTADANKKLRNGVILIGDYDDDLIKDDKKDSINIDTSAYYTDIEDNASQSNKTKVCRVGVFDILKENGDSRESVVCELINEYGVSDHEFVKIEFPIHMLHNNRAKLQNRTWFIQYNTDWVYDMDWLLGDYIVKFLDFPHVDSIKSMSLNEVEEYVISEQKKSDIATNTTTHSHRRNRELTMYGPLGLINKLFELETKTIGIRKTKIVLVDSVISETEAYDRIFGKNDRSMKTILDGCSNKQLSLVPYDAQNRSNTVMRISPTEHISMYGYQGLYMHLAPKILSELNLSFFTRLSDIATLWIFVLSDDVMHGGGETAWAPMFGYHFGVLESWFSSTQTMMHELGHNLGQGHANMKKRGEYQDVSSVMGGSQQVAKRCYNGLNMWHMGWFKNNRYYISALQKDRNELVNLAFFGDADNIDRKKSNIPVIIQIGKLYLTLNRAKGVNYETGAALDSVVIVEEGIDINFYSNLVGALYWDGNSHNNVNNYGSGVQKEFFQYKNYDIWGTTLYVSVCDNYISNKTHPYDTVTLAIGSNSSGCEGV